MQSALSYSIHDPDHGRQRLHRGTQLHRRHALSCLLRQEGDMDEAHLHVGIAVVMQEGIEQVVADEGARRIGEGAGNALLLHRLYHVPHGEGGKIGGGGVLHDGGIHGAITRVVGDGGLAEVDAHHLGGHRRIRYDRITLVRISVGERTGMVKGYEIYAGKLRIKIGLLAEVYHLRNFKEYLTEQLTAHSSQAKVQIIEVGP